MSNFDNAFDDAPVYQAPLTNKRGKVLNGYQKPPYRILAIGFAVTPITSLLVLQAPASGSNTILVGLLLWFTALASYFAPFALFTLSDLEKQASLNYVPNPPKSKKLRTLLLIEGSLFLLFPTYYLASSLASWVAVILG